MRIILVFFARFVFFFQKQISMSLYLECFLILQAVFIVIIKQIITASSALASFCNIGSLRAPSQSNSARALSALIGGLLVSENPLVHDSKADVRLASSYAASDFSFFSVFAFFVHNGLFRINGATESIKAILCFSSFTVVVWNALIH